MKSSRTVWELGPVEDFGFRGHKNIMNKVTRLLSLFLLPPNIIKIFKPLRSYGMHKNLAKKFLPGR